MAIRVNNFQPVKYGSDRHSIGGKLAVAAKRGQIVNRKSGVVDELELATDKAGFFLARDVMSAANAKLFVEADELRPDKAGFQSPYVIDGSVQAEDFEEVWVEGTDLLDAAMDVNVAVGAQLTSAAGKFKPITHAATQETIGKVVLNIAAVNTAAPARRFLIQIVRGTAITI
jgi:hypothetical protein